MSIAIHSEELAKLLSTNQIYSYAEITEGIQPTIPYCSKEVFLEIDRFGLSISIFVNFI